ncbi:MAG: ABC transporter ATP-binding protein [Lachnospiraceae bacterium]|jgi:ATP-binding cassette subfamily B protein|nr:ABC transporter ATP-binding protein [Lachnospiraceae bacterium]
MRGNKNTFLFIFTFLAKRAPLMLAADLFYYSSKYSLVVLNSVWLLKAVLERLLEPEMGLGDILKLLVLFLGINGVFDLFESLYIEYWQPLLVFRAKERIERELMERARRLSLRCYEDTAFYDTVRMTENCLNQTLFMAYGGMMQSLGQLAALANTVWIMAGIDRVLLLFMLCVIPTFFLLRRTGSLRGEKAKALAQTERIRDSVAKSWLNKSFVREYKTTQAAQVQEKHYDEAYQKGIGIHRAYGSRLMKGSFGVSFFSLTFVQLACYGYGLYGVWHREGFTVAQLSVVFLAVANMLSRMNKILRQYEKIGRLSAELSALQRFKELETEDTGEKEIAPFRTLEFDRVSFSYDGPDAWSMQEISFRIRAGETVCLAGYNGAGKSTLVKLLFGFYTPDSGRILYNGVDIREYNRQAYRARLCAVFQDFYLFGLTLGQNISLSETGDRERMEKALELADGGELTGRLGCQLGREFCGQGTELSGGQRQKLAIARALYGGADILIMDEPDAALDPVSADRILSGIRREWKEKTILFISHQMSSAREADRVLMLAEGRLAEQGTHEELMRMNGIYAKFFRCQAAAYGREKR